MKHHIYYIMGKSASGKDHIYEALMQRPDIKAAPLVIYTTRPMRAGEKDGREYFFTDVRHLEELRRQGRIIEQRCYHTVQGPWYYFTADEGQLNLDSGDYLGIGTLESYEKMLAYFGAGIMVPIYIEVENGLRLERALQREKKQKKPDYTELCRRFLADEEDFSEGKIQRAGIQKRFENNGTLEECVNSVAEYIQFRTDE